MEHLLSWILLSIYSLITMRGFIYGGDDKVYGILTNILFSITIGWLIVVYTVICETIDWIFNIHRKLTKK